MPYLFRLLILSLLFSVMAFGAKGDRRYQVLADQYKQNESLKVDEKTSIGTIGQTLKSTRPQFPLAVNTFYLRHKHGGNAYGWYVGDIASDRFENLHAFDLSANRLSAYEASQLRFYATRREKPFQDESDIYFDKRFLYTSRVREIFFMRNGEWQRLTSVPLSGIVKVEAPAGAAVIIGSSVLGKAPVTLYPVRTGIFYATFVVPQTLPVTIGASVHPGKLTKVMPNIIPLDSTRYTIQTNVTAEAVALTRSLEETEVLYDQFIADIAKSSIGAGVVPFDSIYPVMKKPPLGMSKEDSSYQGYVMEFENTRARAKTQWQDSKSRDLVAFNRLLMSRLDFFEKDTVRDILIPTSVTVLPMEKVISLRYATASKRHDMVWMGAPKNLVYFDSIVNAMKDPKKLQIYITLQNKPVWIEEKDVVVSRHHYRYLKLEFVYNGVTIEGMGKFILSDYILAQPEVQLWLNPPPKSVVLPPKDTVKKVVDQPQPVVDPLIDFYRGRVVEIDSGSFRYRGKIVSLSPYAIHKTEVTQDHYRRIIGNDSVTFKGENIPVHNVTWNQANAFCKAVGGFLPTEAQWEYAGRAANNEGSLWNLDENPDPWAYAVFEKNSYDLSDKDSLYGPRNVGSKKPNEWGLYDMSGNLAEWTRDLYSAFSFYVEGSNPTGSLLGYENVIKGGSWKSDEDGIDLTSREAEDPRFWSDDLGFRCAFPSHQKVDLEKAKKILKDRGVTIPTVAPEVQEK